MNHLAQTKLTGQAKLAFRSSKLHVAGIASCFGVVGLVATTLLCPTSTHVHAEEAEGLAEAAQVSDVANLSIALDDSAVAIDINPNENNGYRQASTKIHIATSNTTGYKISMSTEDGTQDLTRDDYFSDKISPIATSDAGITMNNFADNTWGYNLNQGDAAGDSFKAVPGAASNVVETDTNATNDTWTLTFGAKVSKTLPAGRYSNKVVLSAVANAPTVTDLTKVSTMQQMTHDICQSTALHVSKQLQDERDGKLYWVTKLADGNCWMTQNLALNLGTGDPIDGGERQAMLTSETSDLGWDGTKYPDDANLKVWAPTWRENTEAGQQGTTGTEMIIPAVLDKDSY